MKGDRHMTNTATNFATWAGGEIARLEAREAELEAENERLRAALADVVAAWVNPGDGAPLKDGEVPALDRARAIVSETEAGGPSREARAIAAVQAHFPGAEVVRVR
jgi:hypothetical protein